MVRRELGAAVRKADLLGAEDGRIYQSVEEGDIVALLRSDGRWRYAGVLVKGGDAVEFVVNAANPSGIAPACARTCAAVAAWIHSRQP